MLAGRVTAVHRSTGRMRTRAPACSVTCWPWRALRLECRASFSGASDNSRCCPEGEEERRPRRTRLTTTRPHPTATDSPFRAFGTNRPKPSTRTERGSDAFPAPPSLGGPELTRVRSTVSWFPGSSSCFRSSPPPPHSNFWVGGGPRKTHDTPKDTKDFMSLLKIGTNVCSLFFRLRSFPKSPNLA